MADCNGVRVAVIPVNANAAVLIMHVGQQIGYVVYSFLVSKCMIVARGHMSDGTAIDDEADDATTVDGWMARAHNDLFSQCQTSTDIERQILIFLHNIGRSVSEVPDDTIRHVIITCANRL